MSRDELLARLQTPSEKEIQHGGNECSACFGKTIHKASPEPRKTVKLTCCKDVFHENCLMGWLSTNRDGFYETRCPGCHKHLYGKEPVSTFSSVTLDPAVMKLRTRSVTITDVTPTPCNPPGQTMKHTHSDVVQKPEHEDLHDVKISSEGNEFVIAGPYVAVLPVTVRAKRFSWEEFVELRKNGTIPVIIPRRALHAVEAKVRKELARINDQTVALGELYTMLLRNTAAGIVCTSTNGTPPNRDEVLHQPVKDWVTKLACNIIEVVCEMTN